MSSFKKVLEAITSSKLIMSCTIPVQGEAIFFYSEKRIEKLYDILRENVSLVSTLHREGNDYSLLTVEDCDKELYQISNDRTEIRRRLYIQNYMVRYPTLRALAIAIVQWCRDKNLDEKNKGLSPMCIAILVIYYFLQNDINVRHIEIPDDIDELEIKEVDPDLETFEDPQINEEIKELLKRFHKFYRDMHYPVVISLLKNRALSASDKNWPIRSLAIEDPFEPEINLLTLRDGDTSISESCADLIVSVDHECPTWEKILEELQASIRLMDRNLFVLAKNERKILKRNTVPEKKKKSKQVEKLYSSSYRQSIEQVGVESPVSSKKLIPKYYCQEDSDKDDYCSDDCDEESLGVLDVSLHKMFLCPELVKLMNIKDSFPTVEEYLKAVRNNILAEYYVEYNSLIDKDCSDSSDSIHLKSVERRKVLSVNRNNNYVLQGLHHSLIAVVVEANGGTYCSLHIIVKQSPTSKMLDMQRRSGNIRDEDVKLTIYPSLPVDPSTAFISEQPRIHFIGYIGSTISEYLATFEVEKEDMELITCVSNPKKRSQVEWLTQNRSHELLNKSQLNVVHGMKYNLEIIQGPPGTGKSHLIHNLLICLPSGRILLTCHSNAAVEALINMAQQFNREGTIDCSDILLYGNERKLSPGSEYFTLEKTMERMPEYKRAIRIIRRFEHLQYVRKKLMEDKSDKVASFLSKRMSELTTVMNEEQLLKYQAKSKIAFFLTKLYIKERYYDFIQIEIDLLLAELESFKSLAYQRARVFLCTINSTRSLRHSYQKIVKEPLYISNIFVDEAGSVPESSIPLLAKMRPKYLVLVGDHVQLPPYTAMSDRQMKGTNYNRSVLERVHSSIGDAMHVMTHQYRMHPHIGLMVSTLFYNKKLVSDEKLNHTRTETVPLLWVDVRADESLDYRKIKDNLKISSSLDDNTKSVKNSYCNINEARAVVNLCNWLAVNRPNKRIMVITFYRAQHNLLSCMLAEKLKDGKVRVLTVDASQGQQEDIVILSCVRSNPEKKIGFVANSNRTCVALSRAKELLIIVGDKQTFSEDFYWKQVQNYCCFKRNTNDINLNVDIPQFKSSNATKLTILLKGVYRFSGTLRKEKVEAILAANKNTTLFRFQHLFEKSLDTEYCDSIDKIKKKLKKVDEDEYNDENNQKRTTTARTKIEEDFM